MSARRCISQRLPTDICIVCDEHIAERAGMVVCHKANGAPCEGSGEAGREVRAFLRQVMEENDD